MALYVRKWSQALATLILVVLRLIRLGWWLIRQSIPQADTPRKVQLHPSPLFPQVFELELTDYSWKSRALWTMSSTLLFLWKTQLQSPPKKPFYIPLWTVASWPPQRRHFSAVGSAVPIARQYCTIPSPRIHCPLISWFPYFIIQNFTFRRSGLCFSGWV